MLVGNKEIRPKQEMNKRMLKAVTHLHLTAESIHDREYNFCGFRDDSMLDLGQLMFLR